MNELILMAAGSNFIRYICSKKDTDFLNQSVLTVRLLFKVKKNTVLQLERQSDINHDDFVWH